MIKKLRVHPFAFILVSIAVVAIGVTLAAGVPKELPDVALGSPALLHVERALLLVIAFFLVFVLLVYAAKGQLPSEVSRDGFKFPAIYPETVEDVKKSSDPSGATTYQDPDNETDVDDSDVHAPDELLVLRLKLEAKLSYIAKFLLRPDECDCATFATIGSLNYDGYLSDEEARTAAQVLALRDEELGTLSPRARREFLAAAGSVVGNIRASVFYGLVRVTLVKNDWTVKEIPAKNRRPDLLVSKGPRCVRIAPRFVIAKNPKRIGKVVRRLERVQEKETAKSKRGLVVLPDRTRNETEPAAEPVATVNLKQLRTTLELAGDPRSLK